MTQTNAAWAARARTHLMHVSDKPPVVMERGAGVELWDVEGRRHLDFIAGWAVNLLGHSPPGVAEALAAQAARLVNASPSFWNRPQIELAERLTAATGMDNTMAASGKPGWDAMFPPRVPGFVHVPFDDLDAATAAIGERTAAVMLERVQGEAGVISASPAYVRGLRALCDARRVLLIFDEVQTGYGRTGAFLASQRYGIRPDVLTLAKGIGGGFPLSALLARDEACVFEAGVFDTTRRPGPEVAAAALARGLLVNAPRPSAIRLMPPLVVEERHVDEALGILERVLQE